MKFSRVIQKLSHPDNTTWLPDLLYTNGRFESEFALVCGAGGSIKTIGRETSSADDIFRLKNRAMLPGLVNAHSHAFQRVIRGRTERRSQIERDSFWTWREMMYSAAARLTPEDIYDASRMAFLEMALSGITTVGEFHYIHHAPDGRPFDDPNLMARTVIEAARNVGLRIALLRVAYARSGYKAETNPRQARFIEAKPENYLRHVESLRSELERSDYKTAWVGVAPHSVRAVPAHYLREIARYSASAGRVPIHMHVSEQPAEVSACLEEHACSPVELLEDVGLLNDRFTAVHGIHVNQKEAHALAEASATVCACPTTERNLGDGVIPADLFFKGGVRVSLGTDSHTQIDLLEDARELEYHLRLEKLERAVLAPDASPSSLAARLFDCASLNGAHSLLAPCGKLETGFYADFFTVDLKDVSIAGASTDDLLSSIVFSMGRSAIRDVFVGGRQIVCEGQHRAQREIVEKFAALQRKLWG